jgi:hypothetical protein
MPMLESSEESLIALVLGVRKTRAQLTPQELAAFDARLMEAAQRAKAVIKARLGQEVENPDLMDSLVDAGVLYMLSRQDQSIVSRDQRDARKEHFEWLLDQASKARKTTSAASVVVTAPHFPAYI